MEYVYIKMVSGELMKTFDKLDRFLERFRKAYPHIGVEYEYGGGIWCSVIVHGNYWIIEEPLKRVGIKFYSNPDGCYYYYRNHPHFPGAKWFADYYDKTERIMAYLLKFPRFTKTSPFRNGMRFVHISIV